MDICKIEGFVTILGAPFGWDQSKVECVGLPVKRSDDGAFVSQWKPTATELAVMNAGGSIYLSVYGDSHPPVGLDVVDAIGQTNYEPREALLRFAIQRMRDTLVSQVEICDIALESTK